jgi:pyrimidine-nucleoside phosphorylase
LQTFSRMIERQGGDPHVVDRPALLAVAPGSAVFAAPRAGYVGRLRASAIGQASNLLGAGRAMVGDPVDHGVGLLVLAKPGDAVSEGQPLVELRHRDGRGLDAALALVGGAVTIVDEAPARRPKVLGEVR